jgi:hypothetical protein
MKNSRLSHALAWSLRPEVVARMNDKSEAARIHSNARAVRRMKERRLTDENYRVGCDLRRQLSSWVIAGRGIRSRDDGLAARLVGLGWAQMRLHISSQFREGMVWETHGEWHLDHVVPLCRFVLPREMFSAFHYTNIRPVWSDEHRLKSRWERKR